MSGIHRVEEIELWPLALLYLFASILVRTQTRRADRFRANDPLQVSARCAGTNLVFA